MLALVNTLFYVVSTLAFTCACVYVSFPFVLKFLPSLVVQGTFLNLMCSPRRVSRLHKPKEAWKLDGVQNHYISSSHASSKLGVWHLSPTERNEENSESEISLATATKVIVYCHGNAWHRCFGHRKYLYSILRQLGFHVITFDYRGYGDSDGWPSEDGVIDDTVTVYRWVLGQAVHPDCKILVWGHSLGTAIATQALLKIQTGEYSQLPSGLILEAPFTSIEEAMTEYPLSKNLAKLYPGNYIEKIMINALTSGSVSFSTISALPQLSSNILMLHAEDDRKVHFKLGKKLYEEIKNNAKTSANVTFAAFKASHGLGHSGIWQHPELPILIQNLLDGCLENGFYEIEI